MDFLGFPGAGYLWERVRRPRRTEAELPGGVGLESAVGGKVMAAGEEEQKEKGNDQVCV